ncbi:MAG: ATP-binding protein [Candidatus Faecousia sp.]|nr:ATP-binding protein [Clostridiales bacterium]MDY6180469.1 ATP-binding protein [Candidatus Faecousia sp.]
MATESSKRAGGLRRRWLINTLGVVSSLGLVCVLAVTASFAAYYYSNMQSDLESRARTTTEFFADFVNQNHDEFIQSCITYTETYEKRNTIELQFFDSQGKIVASSYGHWAGDSPSTPEIPSAISTRDADAYVGKDPVTGERIIAVSGPVIYSSGEVVGVFRYVTSTRLVDVQIFLVALVSTLVLMLVLGAVLLSSTYCIRSVLNPVDQIIEKAKRIASGSYGAQIQTKYDDEIGELANTINEMSVKISQNEKMQAEFISQLSHELRTPLTVINGWSETLLANEDMDPDTRQGMKIISSEAKRLTEMVMELLDFTRMQDGRVTLTVEPTDLRSEFEDTVFMYGSRLAQDGIELNYLENDQEIPEIPCDPKRLRQVFLNILDNAAKHGGEGKKIDASIAREGDWVVVRIRDYGPGIPEDEIPLVKKKFYKGSSKARGTGIGLAVCDEIVEMHGGTLTLENAPGGGTMVTVRLPVGE